MTAPQTEHPLDGLVYQSQLVVSWQSVDQLPSPRQLARDNESNEWFLRAANAFNELSPDASEDHPELAQDIARLELKINLLLELVGQNLCRQLSLPAAAPVRLSSHGMEWQCGDRLQPGDIVSLAVYLLPGLPRPIQFYGTVTEAEEGSAVVRFYGVSGNVEDWLDKFIFRHHRRAIAHSRTSGDID